MKIPFQGEQVNLTQIFWEQVEFLLGLTASENLSRRRRLLRVAIAAKKVPWAQQSASCPGYIRLSREILGNF